MTNKIQNKFRGENYRRLSAMEAMMRMHRREELKGNFAGRQDRVKIGIYGIPMVTLIFTS